VGGGGGAGRGRSVSFLGRLSCGRACAVFFLSWRFLYEFRGFPFFFSSVFFFFFIKKKPNRHPAPPQSSPAENGPSLNSETRCSKKTHASQRLHRFNAAAYKSYALYGFLQNSGLPPAPVENSDTKVVGGDSCPLLPADQALFPPQPNKNEPSGLKKSTSIPAITASIRPACHKAGAARRKRIRPRTQSRDPGVPVQLRRPHSQIFSR